MHLFSFIILSLGGYILVLNFTVCMIIICQYQDNSFLSFVRFLIVRIYMYISRANVIDRARERFTSGQLIIHCACTWPFCSSFVYLAIESIVQKSNQYPPKCAWIINTMFIQCVVHVVELPQVKKSQMQQYCPKIRNFWTFVFHIT